MNPELFPGQVLVAETTYEQLACLASPARNEVFWNVSGVFPRSIAEIATMLGKSASGVTYHIMELAKVGLVIPAGERKKRSRTETLYVWGSRRGFMTRGADAPKEYRELSLHTVEGMLRLAMRERAEVTRSYDFSDELSPFSTARRLSTKLTPERAEAFKNKMVEQIREFVYAGHDPDGVTVSIMFVMNPSLQESRRVIGVQPRKRIRKETLE